jgi:hypothetical protein
MEIYPYTTYTCKQILTIELEGDNIITYYAGDTWQTLAEREPIYHLTVKEGKVYNSFDEIICDNDYNPVKPTDLIESTIDYHVNTEY